MPAANRTDDVGGRGRSRRTRESRDARAPRRASNSSGQSRERRRERQEVARRRGPRHRAGEQALDVVHSSKPLAQLAAQRRSRLKLRHGLVTRRDVRLAARAAPDPRAQEARARERSASGRSRARSEPARASVASRAVDLQGPEAGGVDDERAAGLVRGEGVHVLKSALPRFPARRRAALPPPRSPPDDPPDRSRRARRPRSAASRDRRRRRA